MASSQSASAAADGRIRRRYGSIVSRRPLPIRHDLGNPPPPLWRRFIHWWRYGSYHPDEDLLGVIDAAIDSLTAQIKAAEGILTGPRLASLDALRQELNVELSDEVPELSVLLGIEAKINALYPPAVQRRRAWMIEERFRRVASGHAADYWTTDRNENRVAEQHGARLDQADHEIAAAEAAETTASAALQRAAAELEAAEDAYSGALGNETEAAVDADLDRLEELQENDPEGADTIALKEQRGALLPLRARARAARDALPIVQAAKDVASWVLERSRLDRTLVAARYEVERIQARMRGTDRAAREAPGGAPAAADATASVAEELTKAQRSVNEAAAALEAHEETRPQGVPGPAPGSAAGAGVSGGAAPAGSSLPFDADSQSLLGYIHSAYLMGIARERAVRDLMRWLMMRFWTANLIFLLSLFAAWGLVTLLTNSGYQYHALISGLFVIAVIGRIGATMSVVQRLQRAVGTNVLANDPIQELTRLRTGKNGINVALFSGGVFALLMYILFASGIPAILGLDDGAAPAISTIQEQQQEEAEQRLRSENIATRAREASQQEELVRRLEQRAAQAAAQGAQPAGDTGAAAALRVQLAQARARLDELRRTAVQVAAADPTGATPEQADSSVPTEPTEPEGDPPQNATSDAGNEVEADLPAEDPNEAETENAAEAVVNTASSDPSPDSNEAANAIDDSTSNAVVEKGPADSGAKPTEAPAQAGAPPLPEQCRAKDSCDPFVLLADALGLADREDFFKLLIWAFLAGFAERLVPDALDSIANRAARRRRRADGSPGEETA